MLRLSLPVLLTHQLQLQAIRIDAVRYRITYKLLVDIEGRVALDDNPESGYNNLLLRLTPEDL